MSKSKIPFTHNMIGLVITRQLPKDVWNIARPYARYEKYEDIEEWVDDQYGWAGVDPHDYVGWYYKKEAMTAFLKAGYRVSYAGVEVTLDKPINEQIEAINEAQDKERAERADKEAQAERERENALKERINSLETELTPEKWAFLECFKGTEFEQYADEAFFLYDLELQDRKILMVSFMNKQFIGHTLDKKYIFLAYNKNFYSDAMTPIQKIACQKNSGYICGDYAVKFVIPYNQNLIDRYFTPKVPKWFTTPTLGRFVGEYENVFYHTNEVTKHCINRDYPLNHVVYNLDTKPKYLFKLSHKTGILWDNGQKDKNFMFPSKHTDDEIEKLFPFAPLDFDSIDTLSVFHSELIYQFGKRLDLESILKIEKSSIVKKELKSYDKQHSRATLNEIQSNLGVFYEVIWICGGYDDAENGVDWFINKAEAEKLYKCYE